MVIQRWQSVLLLIATVLMALFSFSSLGQLQTEAVTFNFTSMGLSPEGIPTGPQTPEGVSTWYFFAVSLLTAVLPLIAIFCFKNFRLQRNLCLIETMLLACVIIIGALLGYQIIDGAQVAWSSMVCAPFISLIAVIMAYQRIMADHRKIADSMRLR